jgi:hypothetical protein
VHKTSFVRKSLARAALVTGAAIAALSLAAPAFAVPVPVSSTPQKMPTFDGGIYATAYLGNTIYVGGTFLNVNWGGKKNPRAGLAAINASTGALLPWAPTTDGKVWSLAVDPATQVVYAGGEFSKINGTARDRLAGINGSTGALTPFAHSVEGLPRTLTVGHGKLYAGGTISMIDSTVRTRLAAFDLATGALSTSWAPTADDTVYKLLSDSSRVYVGGKFHSVGGGKSPKLAAVTPDTGVLDATFKPSVSVLVYDIVVAQGAVFAAEGGQGGRAISYSPAGAKQWTFTTDGDVQALAYLGNILYVGGHFDNACTDAVTGTQGVCTDGSTPRVKLAAVDAATGVLNAWNPSANGVHGIFSMASNATLGTVDVAGEFTTLGGTAHGRFGQFK